MTAKEVLKVFIPMIILSLAMLIICAIVSIFVKRDNDETTRQTSEYENGIEIGKLINRLDRQEEDICSMKSTISDYQERIQEMEQDIQKIQDKLDIQKKEDLIHSDKPTVPERPDYPIVEKKPVIYLYGYEGDVSVKLDLSDDTRLTCTYPEYDNSWDVVASPDGHLTDKKGNIYRYLYWEGESSDFTINEGFCITGEDTADFLRRTLKMQGLNDDEINEFIIFWLPQMQNNPYNVISFQTAQYEEKAKLLIDPMPDRMIRVYMTWYGSDEYINIPVQEIKDVSGIERTGKTVVEWGGSMITPIGESTKSSSG